MKRTSQLTLGRLDDIESTARRTDDLLTAACAGWSMIDKARVCVTTFQPVKQGLSACLKMPTARQTPRKEKANAKKA